MALVIWALVYFPRPETLFAEYDNQRIEVMNFKNPLVALFYIVSITLLCSHLSHGIASLFQTLGFRTARNEKTIQQVGLGLAVVLWLGFVSIPLAVVTRVYTDPLAEEGEPVTEIQRR